MFSNKQETKVNEELSQSSNNISKGTVLEGNIETYGNIRVEGKIIGNIRSKSKVVLAPTAVIEGNIQAQNAEIEGEVKGYVEVSELLTLKKTANVHGDIVTTKLVVESGGLFNGSCKMGESIKEIKLGQPKTLGRQENKKAERAKAV